MTSTCVLSPNAFNAQSITCSPSVVNASSAGGGGSGGGNSVTGGGIIARSMAMGHEFIQHPALRGWNSSPNHSLSMTTSENYSSTTANEVMRGSLTLLSSSQPQRILLSVIRTTVDHLALVYLDNRRNLKCVKPAGCINLRGVTCEEIVLGNGITGITLRPKKSDTSSSNLTFVCHEPLHLAKWMEALSQINTENKRNIPKKCSLPSLEEEEE